MLLAVAGCVAQAEGAEIIARAAGGGSGGGAAILSSPAGDDRAHRARGRPCAGDRFSGAGKIRCPAEAAVRQRRQRLSDRAGRLRQVLHLLRGALYARRRTFAPAAADRCARRGVWSTRARARSCCWARTSMPIAARVRTARLVAGAAAATRSRDIEGMCAHPLHHQPSARHGRRSDRRPWRQSPS